MGHLVGHHLGDALAGACRGILRVHQQGGFTVGDAAPVLHGPRGEVGNGDVVQLGQRVGDVEIIVEISQQLDRGVEGEPGLVLFASRGPYADFRAVGSVGLHRYDVADNKGQQVGGHYGGFAKPDGLEARPRRPFLHDRRVGYCLVFVGEDQRDVEYGLLGRLVPAGESPAGVGSLELGSCQVPGLPFRILVLRAIEADQPVV